MILEIGRITRKRLLIVWILLTGFTGKGIAQGNVNQWVKEYIAGEGKDVQTFNAILQHNPSTDVAKAIEGYVNDTTHTTFEYAVFLIKKMEKRITDKPGRVSLINSLLACALKQKPQLCESALRTMTLFDKSLFSEEVKESIQLIAAQYSLGRKEAILLLGYIGGSNDISFLNGLGKYTKLSKQDKYYQQLALVRLNDGEAVNAFFLRIQEGSFNDEMVINTVPDLVYTHNKRIYDLLINEIMNDARNCRSANNDSDERIICAYRIMEQLAANRISGFPIQLDRSGEIIGDYSEALKRVRDWILSTKSEYSIITNTY